MAGYRTLAEWEGLDGDNALTEAECELIRASAAGEVCVLGDGIRPQESDPARNIRCDLLTYLLLGGCDDCHVDTWGVSVQGAYILGRLDVSFEHVKGGPVFVNCAFEEEFTAVAAQFRRLGFCGSAAPRISLSAAKIGGDCLIMDCEFGALDISQSDIKGDLKCEKSKFGSGNNLSLNAVGVRVRGDALLKEDFHAKSGVSFRRAEIDGDFRCDGGRLERNGGIALDLQAAHIRGAVYLSRLERDHSRQFHSSGEVRLTGVRIDGPLVCYGGRFEHPGGRALRADAAIVSNDVFLSDGFCAAGEVDLSGTKISGQLCCVGGTFANENEHSNALILQSTLVGRGFLWRRVSVPSGNLVLSSAHVSDLVDDLKSWPDGQRLVLDGFTYDRITASFTDAQTRLKWLEKGCHWKGEFYPQPYIQLAKVFREMGHDRAAREVMIEKERLLAGEQIRADCAKAAALWAGEPSQRGDIGKHWLRRHLFRLWNWLIRNLVGYGYAPQNAVYWAVGTLCFLNVFYFIIWRAGGLVPNSPVVLNSADWAKAMASDAIFTGRLWADTAPSAAHYETFWSGFYAADVFIPLIDFGQEAAWTATTRNVAGWTAFVATFAFKGFGWLITALGAAAITGIIRRE